jgi:alginate O-acetyltransferase complex protein AlgI
VAGPIVRAREFLPQLDRAKRWDWARLQLGLALVVMGLFKKLAIADRMAMFADPVFADPGEFRTGALWMATLAFAIQVYADFSGYSDMAIGLSHALGYKLARNFEMPFRARNISDFWRRWHISLSSWLRDYVYIPLGGSRCSAWRSDVNLLLTMFACGLWHGANWTFIIFGIVQGCLMVLHRRFRNICLARPNLNRVLQTAPAEALCVALTFATFCLTLVIFRNATLQSGLSMLERMFASSAGSGIPMNDRGLWYTVILVAVCHVLGAWEVHKRSFRVPAPIQGLACAAAATLALVLCPELGKAFVYFQF